VEAQVETGATLDLPTGIIPSTIITKNISGIAVN